MDWEYIIYEKQDRIARIIMNRPEKRNPLGGGMMGEIHKALEDVYADNNIRVVIIKANGPSFSSGHDLEGFLQPDAVVGTAMQTRGRPAVRPLFARDDHIFDWYYYIFNFPKPIIAQVQGYCMHGANNLQAMCDITIAAEDAQFQGKGPPIVIIPVYLPIVSITPGLARRNLELHINGKDAERYGLITRAVPADKLEEEVNRLAQAVAQMPADGLELNKEALNGLLHAQSLSGAWKISSRMHAMGTVQRHHAGEYSMFKGLRDKGVTETIHSRQPR